MKVELSYIYKHRIFYNEYENILTFSFWKRDVKTREDKELIADFVRHLYHMNCIDSSYSEQQVE